MLEYEQCCEAKHFSFISGTIMSYFFAVIVCRFSITMVLIRTYEMPRDG